MTPGSRERTANENHHLHSARAQERIQLDVRWGILGI